MRAFRDYWTFSAIRGAMTIVAALFILGIPQGALFVDSLPLADGVKLSVDFFATYCLFDAAAILLIAYMLPGSAKRGTVLYIQAAVGAGTAAILYALLSGAASFRWVVWIVALQAGAAAVTEMMMARKTHRQYSCFSCYATAIVLAVCAICLPFGNLLDATGLSLVLGAYVALYGTSEFVLGGRMLFVEYREEHPASVASMTWRAETDRPVVSHSRIADSLEVCRKCVECPAEAICGDYSLHGQVAQIMLKRQPAVVRSTRVAAVLEAAGTAHR